MMGPRRFGRCRPPRATTSPSAASVSSDVLAACTPFYVRGLAYLAARQPAEAAAEFQKIVDHRSIVLVDPMDAMARLQLARALVLSGETAKAKSAYNDLFALWKDADPKIPIVDEARAEYGKLQ